MLQESITLHLQQTLVLSQKYGQGRIRFEEICKQGNVHFLM